MPERPPKKRYQVQAFLPEHSDFESSPLGGIGSLFVPVRAHSIQEAQRKFYEMDNILIDLNEDEDNPDNQRPACVVIVSTRMCPLLLIQDVTAEILAQEAVAEETKVPVDQNNVVKFTRKK